MKAMILCAGLGTRLKPWTESHPKALVPVGGVPMLRRVIDRLAGQGFDEVTVNVHHFSHQVKDYLMNEVLPVKHVNISDESERLLDTGGGILNASDMLSSDPRPFLVHNVDILSNADLACLYDVHVKSEADITLLVSSRNSDRRLVFDSNMNLKGWINCLTGQVRPDDLVISDSDQVLAFSGIYIMSTGVFDIMKKNGFSGKFPIMDFFLSGIEGLDIRGYCQKGLEIIDIGKPATLEKANITLVTESTSKSGNS